MTPLEVAGEVVSVSFEHNEVRLGLYPAGEVAVSSTVEVTRERERFDFDPQNAGPQVSHIHARIGETVRATSTQDGALTIKFGDRYVWLCAPSPEYEAWTVASASARWISAPGGQIIEYS